MSALRFTVPFHRGETLRSFVSRLAAANGCLASREFCHDMAIKVTSLDRGDLETIDRLATLGSANSEEIRRSVMLFKQRDFWLGDHRLNLNQVIRSKFRICPRCLLEDLESGEGVVHSRPWLRTAWSVALVRSCPIHGNLLVLPDWEIPRICKDDIALIVPAFRSQLQSLGENVEIQPASALEAWMAARLAGQHGGSEYLAKLPLAVGVQLAETVGASIIHGKKFKLGKFTAKHWLDAGRAGFQVVSEGEDSIRQYLSSLAAQRDWLREVFGGRKLFGVLHRRLNLSTDPDFNPVRELVQSYVIDNHPIGPEDSFLGAVPRRRWHSVSTASKVFKLHPKRIRKILLESGLIDADIARKPDPEIMFESAAADELFRKACDQAGGALTPREARNLIGANNRLWSAIVRRRLVVPLAGNFHEAVRYARNELDAFVASTAYSTNPADVDSMRDILTVARMTRTEAEEIIDLLCTRSLENVALTPGQSGLAAVLVSPEEVRLRLGVGTRLNAQQASQRMNISSGQVRALMAKGYISSEVWSFGPCLNLEAVDAFSRRYLSGPQVVEQLGQVKSGSAIRQVTQALENLGIQPAISRAEVGINFFERSAFEQVRTQLEAIFSVHLSRKSETVASSSQ